MRVLLSPPKPEVWVLSSGWPKTTIRISSFGPRVNSDQSSSAAAKPPVGFPGVDSGEGGGGAGRGVAQDGYESDEGVLQGAGKVS